MKAQPLQCIAVMRSPPVDCLDLCSRSLYHGHACKAGLHRLPQSGPVHATRAQHHMCAQLNFFAIAVFMSSLCLQDKEKGRLTEDSSRAHESVVRSHVPLQIPKHTGHYTAAPA